MSDQIPFHIQEEIMKRLPATSLIKFRSVSKAWKSLIDNSEFLAAHFVISRTQPQHLLVSYNHHIPDMQGVLFTGFYIDDHTFPQQMSVPTLPLSVKELKSPRVVGSSHGLLCVYGFGPNYSTKMIVLWNPSIRRSIVVAVPGELYYEPDPMPYEIEPFFGFGVCPVTSDPKIVAIRQFSGVLVYMLSSGEWRSISPNLPVGSLLHCWSVVDTDQFIYWCARSRTHKMIMSFDVTNESFEAIDLPDSLARHGSGVVKIAKLRESPALLQYNDELNSSTVWIMEHGFKKSFTKLFTINTRYEHEFIVGFRKSGIPLVQVIDDEDDEHFVYETNSVARLVVYEPNSEHDNVLDICPSFYFFIVNSYMGTLLLHGRSDCSSD